MKKTIIIIITIIIVLVCMAFIALRNMQNEELKLVQFNKQFETYQDRNFYGADVASIINKAIDNNEKYEIPKDEKNIFIPDEKYSVKVYVKMLESDDVYDMDVISNVGIEQFIFNYNNIKFHIIGIEYHEQTNRVSNIYIEETTT